METISERPILADLETDDELNVSLILHVAGEYTGRRHRRHRVIHVQLYQNPEGTLLHGIKQQENEHFLNADGAVDFTMPLRPENMSVKIPYTVLPSLSYGDLISISIHLEDTAAGEVLSEESLDLLTMKSGRLDYFSHQRMREYLRSEPRESIQLAKAAFWVKQNAENIKVVRMGLDIIRERADKGSSDAIKTLAGLYKNPRIAKADQKDAAQWQKRLNQQTSENSEQKKQGAAAKKRPVKITDEASLKTCEQLAESGDQEAQYLIYAYSCTKEGSDYDSSKAFAYLKAAAAAGEQKAVRTLAEAYEKNLIYISSEDVHEYISILDQAAEKKQADAEYILFRIAYTGESLGHEVHADKKDAYSWLLDSAAHGGAQAAYDLWDYFEHGNEFLMDQESALKWLVFAADQGLPKAKTRLGDLYIDGHYIEKDDQKGIALLNEAAALNEWGAQMKQFQGYYEGRYKDVLWEKDRSKAYDLLKRFAHSGNPKACIQIMDKYEQGNELMMEHREAANYLRSASENGDAEAMYRYANILLDGYYVSADPERARQLIDAAAALGYPDAQFALYQFYLDGFKSLKNKRPNRERAYRWLFKAAQTLPSAQYEIWKLSKSDASMDLSIAGKEAADYLFRSATQKYGPALYQVGMALGNGEGVEPNPERGLRLIEEAAACHHPKAVYELAQIRLNGSFGGQETVKDEKEGMHLLLLSAELHYPEACKQVGEWYTEGKLDGESESWIRQIVQVAIDAGIEVGDRASQQTKQEAAAAK
ncbi:sel1 repeat family protein [Sporolactobacillus sp. CPB3-1]|uniref:Sel1 repeat family protein n=1 Tax=Sporolactobacillus mangiferae TaxID=2940498 RepID=A0ABT0MB48_9BACL|nr:sel1 repeat family protein [Sporolactobacillus mangiferae]MCL1632087.1 sel1 repeat family protein [Sporolactobacillus mangiferae]